MIRVVLVHWKTAEAEERIFELVSAGFEVALFDNSGGRGLEVLRHDPPDVFVIDLGRLPSQGRDLAIWLRQQKPTRRVPLVFVGGDLEKTKAIRQLLPDAVYGSWRGIAATVKRAARNPPAEPVVLDSFAGYSGTPLPKKLGIKEGSTVTLMGAPGGFAEVLEDLPRDVRIKHRAAGRADLVVLFAHSTAELRRRFPAAGRVLVERGRLWIAWPKKSSGMVSDLTQQVVREYGLERDWVDFKVCAIDPTWSGLCFVRRRK